MKLFFFPLFVFTLMLTLFLLRCTSSPPPQTPLTEEKTLNFKNLVWSDEFDGDQLNLDNWNYDIGTGAERGLVGWGNNELQYYTSEKENVRVENGELVITALKKGYRGSKYTSARITSRGKMDVLYGRIEARIKIPTIKETSAKGIWPAFWLLPTDNYYGKWAASGELDIMEILGHEPYRVHGTLHFGGAWPEQMRSGRPFQFTGKQSLVEDYHIYAVEWNKERINWYIDDQEFFSLAADEWISLVDEDNPIAPFDKRFHVIFNLAVGGNWPGKPDQDTAFPQEMRVDYIRVYR